MKIRRPRIHAIIVAAACVLLSGVVCAAGDPLPSWNEGSVKQAAVEFVARVTNDGGPDFVPPAERIAVFDNDGTLWQSSRSTSRCSSRLTA